MKISKLIIALIFIFVFVGLINVNSTFAQRSQVRTRVGNPKNNTVAPAVDPSQLQSSIQSEFGITMTGFSTQHLQWAWEKFWEVSDTSFRDLVRGSTIVATCGVSGCGSSQVGCFQGTSVVLGQYNPESLFKFILIHELGHVIHNCHDRSKTRMNDIINAAAPSNEGAVSYYGANASSCTGSDNNSENYADVVAYYLTPSAGLSSASCGGQAPQSPPNPFWGNQVLKPLQLNIIKQVLGEHDNFGI